MKILFITQRVDLNDDLLGFVHGWLERLATKLEKISVVALGVGEYHLPKNVEIFSLGKNQVFFDRMGRWEKRLKYTLNFYRHIWRLRRDYDLVFVHMNVEYVLLAGLFWRLWRKKIVLWYIHINAPIKLKIAAVLSHRVFTATKESCRVKSKKLRVLQHGIDAHLFAPEEPAEPGNLNKILSLGRISPVKNLEILIEAFGNLIGQGKALSLDIVGAPKSENDAYYEKIKNLVAKKNLGAQVNFLGAVPNRQAAKIFNKHGIFVNLTAAGSFDKSTLEAMSCGLLVLVSNPAFVEILPERLQALLMFKERDSRDLAQKMDALFKLPAGELIAIKKYLRQAIEDRHSLNKLIEKFMSGFDELLKNK